MSKMSKLTVVLCLFALLGANAWGQGIFATLNGVVSDPIGCAGERRQGDIEGRDFGVGRQTTTNSDGYFTFASVPVGSYELSVEAQGFQTYKATDIRLGGAERRNNNVTLTVALPRKRSRSRHERFRSGDYRLG